MAQKVLVTGATGFIGIEVSRQLAERGMRPRLMVRRPVRGLMLRNLEAEIMQADIRSPKSLDRILKGMDTVIHLGARAAFEPYPRLRVTHIPRTISYMGTRILDLFFGLTAQANPYPSGAISSWNLRLPVEPGTIRQTIGVEPKFATIHQGIPAVLDDSISFYWLPSNLDRL